MFSVELRYRARKIYRSVKQIVELVSNVLLFLASFLAIILVIYRFGFDMPADYSHEIYYTRSPRPERPAPRRNPAWPQRAYPVCRF